MDGLRSRRAFLCAAGLAGAGVACSSLPRRASWPARGGADSLRLAFFTDVHARVEWQTPLAMEMAASAINEQRPELIIAGGDLITEGFESTAEKVAPRWGAYLEMHRALAAPVAPVIGNHDLVAAAPEDGSEAAADPRAVFRETFALDSTFRSFDAAGYHFIVLDAVDETAAEHPYIGRVHEAALAWLEKDLEQVAATTPIVLASHIPLMTGFYQATEGATAAAPANRIVTNSSEVLQRFAHHNLLLVLQGHLHVDEMLRWGKTTFITGGAVCGKWWRGSWHGTREGFGLLTLRRESVDWQYLDYGWTARRPEHL